MGVLSNKATEVKLFQEVGMNAVGGQVRIKAPLHVGTRRQAWARVRGAEKRQYNGATTARCTAAHSARESVMRTSTRASVNQPGERHRGHVDHRGSSERQRASVSQANDSQRASVNQANDSQRASVSQAKFKGGSEPGDSQTGQRESARRKSKGPARLRPAQMQHPR